jgi:hypothetical protein
MDGDRATLVCAHGRRRPRRVLIAAHLGLLAAVTLGSGAVGAPERSGDAARAGATRPNAVPGPLHRYSECCAGSKDPSMEVY